MRRALCIASLTMFFVLLSCQGGSPPSDGFQVETLEETNAFGGTLVSPVPFTGVSGNWVADLTNATGAVTTFSKFSNSNAIAAVPDARVPAKWNLGETTGPCGGKTLMSFVTINAGEDIELACIVPVDDSFTLSPSIFD